MLRRAVLIVIAYGAAWLLTATVGREQVRAPILAAVRDTVLRDRPERRAVEVRSHDGFARLPPDYKQYYVTASCPAPFLVHVHRGYLIEALWGSGAEEWHLWLFGLKRRLAWPTVWWS
jgi:hypothetical protein